jgi:hypothetical protein
VQRVEIRTGTLDMREMIRLSDAHLRRDGDVLGVSSLYDTHTHTHTHITIESVQMCGELRQQRELTP